MYGKLEQNMTTQLLFVCKFMLFYMPIQEFLTRPIIKIVNFKKL